MTPNLKETNINCISVEQQFSTYLQAEACDMIVLVILHKPNHQPFK